MLLFYDLFLSLLVRYTSVVSWKKLEYPIVPQSRILSQDGDRFVGIVSRTHSLISMLICQKIPFIAVDSMFTEMSKAITADLPRIVKY